MKEINFSITDENIVCKYMNECNSYNPKECHCNPELCYLYEMYLEEEIKQMKSLNLYRRRKVDML